MIRTPHTCGTCRHWHQHRDSDAGKCLWPLSNAMPFWQLTSKVTSATDGSHCETWTAHDMKRPEALDYFDLAVELARKEPR